MNNFDGVYTHVCTTISINTHVYCDIYIHTYTLVCIYITNVSAATGICPPENDSVYLYLTNVYLYITNCIYIKPKKIGIYPPENDSVRFLFRKRVAA